MLINKLLRKIFQPKNTSDSDLEKLKREYLKSGARTSDQIQIMSISEEVIKHITFGGGKA